MAVKDSGEIATNSNYALGDYSFSIERSSVPGSSNDKIEAICTNKDGKNARKSIQIPSTANIGGWYVEANSDVATVYALVQIPEGGGEASSDLIDYSVPLIGSASIEYHRGDTQKWLGEYSAVASVGQFDYSNGEGFFIIGASASQGTVFKRRETYWYMGSESVTDTDFTTIHSYTYNNKTAYFHNHPVGYVGELDSITLCGTVAPQSYSDDVGKVAWTMVYGHVTPEDYSLKEVMVGRFAIELEDAGGVGPGSDWTDPGDYDPDWEEGDPTHTLYVIVTGALSGRHNDPIEDPSYSYIPADKDTVKDYGCGGDGGHGGGGGAGASTVVVHKFATNQANSKEVTAIARRHGYGSGGGKGGKGGDGCILVYY